MENLDLNKRILVLDKDTRILSVVDEIMHVGHYDMHIVFDPNAVYDKARDIKPDLVILDYLLLNNECEQICQDFKNDPEMSGIPIIVVAKYKTRKVTADSYKCDALFVKPLDVPLFASRMDYLMAS